MEHTKKQNIIYFYIGGFAVPPLAWLFMGFYVNIFSLRKIFDISLLLPVVYSIFLGAVFVFLSKYLSDIESALHKKDNKTLYGAQKSITHLPKFYLIAVPVFAVVLPITSEPSITVILTFEFFMEWVFGVFIIFLTSIPFFLLMLGSFENAVQDIPPSSSLTDLNLDSKYFLISIPNIVGTFLVTVSTYILIFLKNDQNPDLIYVLFTKSIVIGLFVIGIFILNYYLLRRQILAPIFKLNDFMNNVILSGGNMNSRISIPNRDEFLTIANNFNRLMEFMRQSVIQIDDTTIDMVNATKRLTQATKKHGYTTNKENEIISEFKKNVNQLKVLYDSLTRDSIQNLNVVNKIYAEIHEINIKTTEIIESMESFTEEIRETMVEAQHGEKSLADMRHNMESLFLVYKDIEEVLGFTNDIAEKINLLSLNASIEAARAGELGIGFSVVAKQIAQLSEDTKKSAIDIQQLLVKSSEKMEAGTDQILSGVQTILTLLNGVQGIENEFGKILFNLKDGMKTYKTLENDGETVRHTESTMANLIASQGDKISSLLDLLGTMDSFSRSNIDSLKELSTTVEHNLHFAVDLQKKVSRFQIKNPGIHSEGIYTPERRNIG
jgi:methyl-accepting chemotaxis protein